MKAIKRILLILVVGVALFVIYLGVIFGMQAYSHFQVKKYRENLQFTASPQVQVLRDAVDLPQMNGKCNLYLYLPPDYEKDSLRSYPVLYYFDGQALFDDIIQQGPEWQVDEVIDHQVAEGKKAAIVIGIESSERRYSEYNPYATVEESITGEEVARWVVEEVKVWVDSNYRTLKAPEYHTIAGASLGGLMAYYTLMKYPEVFGNAIVLSPSFWVSEEVYQLHKDLPDLSEKKIYLSVGSLEGWNLQRGTRKMYKTLKKSGMPDSQLRFDYEWGYRHWHLLWRKAFS